MESPDLTTPEKPGILTGVAADIQAGSRMILSRASPKEKRNAAASIEKPTCNRAIQARYSGPEAMLFNTAPVAPRVHPIRLYVVILPR